MRSDRSQVPTQEIPTDVLSRVADFPGLPRLAGKLVPVNRVRELYRRVRLAPDGFRLENLLAEMQVRLQVEAADVARIPATGAVVAVANHPFGVLDGVLLSVLLTRVRPDVKVMTNFLLGDVPELNERCIFVDPFDSAGSRDRNLKGLRQSLHWLERGGMLAVFPAGEVSHLQFPQAQVADPVWNDLAVRLVRRTGASALPIYFCGQNSVSFQLFGLLHPRLRTAFLLQEFLQQQGKPVEIRVGSRIEAEAITAIADDREAIEYLRWRSYLLARRSKTETSWPAAVRSKFALPQKPVAKAARAELLIAELERLPEKSRLIESGDFAVYLAEGSNSPNLLDEIGRLREITFRQAGEGTGKSLDLDRFDSYYWHLLLWNKSKQELAGAYRAGSTPEILPKHGLSGLYTSTLFRFDAHIFEKLGPALELGRSFVRPEYQRQYAPLLLLWKGIARLVALHPELPVLFGAVSISNDYSPASREMIYRFFETRAQQDELSDLVQPRRAFRPARMRPWDCRAMARALRHIEDLSEPIIDVESDGKGLPVLLRQYAKIGGRLLGFNVDRKFSNVLDGLIVVDLRQTEDSVLEKYMGRNGAAHFRARHTGSAIEE